MKNLKNYFYLVIFLMIFSFITTPFLIEEQKSDNLTTVSYKVVKGDNLWLIGQKLNINNISKFVFEVKKVNNLSESSLSVDQVIIIP
ncbi:LysM peptidoglycan-binding domain-containing protein [Candidatus Actinomarina]|nr:LysM peptidoglycan-binding domain-containing protein [Candidatus Actinomarina sp.]